jgi:hypothetical protein
LLLWVTLYNTSPRFQWASSINYNMRTIWKKKNSVLKGNLFQRKVDDRSTSAVKKENKMKYRVWIAYVRIQLSPTYKTPFPFFFTNTQQKGWEPDPMCWHWNSSRTDFSVSKRSKKNFNIMNPIAELQKKRKEIGFITRNVIIYLSSYFLSSIRLAVPSNFSIRRRRYIIKSMDDQM